MAKKVVLIGGGIGNLTLALLLSKDPNKYEITIYEQRNRLGGRLDYVEFSDGSKIDSGPTIILLAKQLIEILKASGMNTDIIEKAIVQLDLIYTIKIQNKTFKKYRDFQKTLANNELTILEKEQLLKYFKKWENNFRKNYEQIATNPFSTLPSMQLISNVFKMKPWKSYFKTAPTTNPLIKASYGLQSLYQGTNPMKTNNILHMIGISEHLEGAGYFQNGYFNLVEIITKELKQRNVNIKLNNKVTNFNPKSKILKINEEEIQADIIVSNIDYPQNTKISKQIKSKNYEASQTVQNFYLKTTKKYDKPVNAFYLSDDFENEMKNVAAQKLTKTNSFYVYYPKYTNSEKGYIYIMFPTSTQNTQVITKNELFELLKTKGYIKSINEIEEVIEKKATDWEEYNLYKKGLFGIAFKTNQMGPFRPKNKTKFKDVYMVGASVHPGGGVPVVMQSAYNCWQLIKEKDE